VRTETHREEDIAMNALSKIHNRGAANGRLPHLLAAVATALALALPSSPALAGATGMQPDRPPAAEQQRQTGPVLPAQARPFGYSLDEMARLVAPFNMTDRSGPPPNTPFQILYQNNVTGATTFDVAQGKFLYVPLLYNDDSAPVIGHFPANAQNRLQLLRYWYSQSEFGVTTMQIVIDGKTASLGAGYVSGLSFDPPLPDGAAKYLTAGAFISPLGRGPHTVEIRFKATGDALREPPFDQYFPDGFWEFSIVYSVNVR
jgi:hypothetical protein